MVDKRERRALRDVTIYKDILFNAIRLGIPGTWRVSSGLGGLLRGGVLFVASSRADMRNLIQISEHPNAVWNQGKSIISHAGEIGQIPQPMTGEAITVWSGGRWIKEGPWTDVAARILGEVEAEIKQRRADAERAENERKAKHEAARKEKHDRLIEAWS